MKGRKIIAKLTTALLLSALSVKTFADRTCFLPQTSLLMAQALHAGVDIRSLETSIVLFQSRTGRLPEEGEFLTLAGSQTDPWNQPYLYRPTPGKMNRNGLPFAVYSTGRDQISHSLGNDPDDLHSSLDTLPPAYRRNALPWLLGTLTLFLILGTVFYYQLLGGIAALFHRLRPGSPGSKNRLEENSPPPIPPE